MREENLGSVNPPKASRSKNERAWWNGGMGGGGGGTRERVYVIVCVAGLLVGWGVGVAVRE